MVGALGIDGHPLAEGPATWIDDAVIERRRSRA
jgi:hypothetical protein